MVKLHYPVYAEIDLDRMHSNLDLLGKRASVPMLPVIKANAYGHGAAALAKEIGSRSDVAGLSVGTVDEALELRKAGYKGRALVLDGVFAEQAAQVVRHKLEVVVSSIDQVKMLVAKAARSPVSIHLKINTGMTRLGADPENAVELYKKAASMKKTAIVGVMTHLADSNKRKGYAPTQIKIFDDILSSIRASGFLLPTRHAANTAAVFLHPKARYDMVRPGIGVYGIQEFGGRDVGLKPVLSLRARIMITRRLLKGTPVSYGMTWVAPRKCKVAVVCAGYADGYSRSFSNKAHAIINGGKIRQIGIVCMDNCLFDVTYANAKTGDVVTLIGEDKKAAVKAVELARLAKTISYEILCGIGRRATRVYIRSGKVEKVDRPKS